MHNHDKSLWAINKKSLKNAKNRMPEHALLVVVVECFKALGDTTRAKILYALRKQPLCVRDLALLVGVSESGISHQLKVLRHKRLVRAVRAGNVMNYSIAYEHIGNLLQEAEYYADHINKNIPDHASGSKRSGKK
jgi:ArsR family transcriptional regulator, lead/cadmium/zinc/bismuth-responsive transcriptional repressor